MKIYYITTKDKKDILFWDADIKVGRRKMGCLAFFCEKEYVQYYKDYLEKIGEENLVIRSVIIK